MILLVEDEAESRYTLARILRHHGYDVMEAADGNEALDLLEKSHFDVVISDLRMPHQTGLVLVAHIHVKWPQMPVLLMSGYLSEDAGKLLSEGWAKFIHKPVYPSDLIATVQRLLQKSKAQTVVASSTPKLYRRKQQSEVWHFSTNCSQWPGEDYVEQRQVPSTSEMCNECTVEWLTANSH
jgi:DNA-binding NtrC family response regulator